MRVEALQTAAIVSPKYTIRLSVQTAAHAAVRTIVSQNCVTQILLLNGQTIVGVNVPTLGIVARGCRRRRRCGRRVAVLTVATVVAWRTHALIVVGPHGVRVAGAAVQARHVRAAVHELTPIAVVARTTRTVVATNAVLVACAHVHARIGPARIGPTVRTADVMTSDRDRLARSTRVARLALTLEVGGANAAANAIVVARIRIAWILC